MNHLRLLAGACVLAMLSAGVPIDARASTAKAAAAANAAVTANPSLDAYASPAERIDIGGGRRLNLRCSGHGVPTVLLDIGQGMTSMSWRNTQPLLAKSHRVCAYDRAGYGFSDEGPLPRSASASADDLAALVRAAKLETPLILVGHSMAGTIVRLYASRHPREVAGLVLVDPVSETLADDAPDYAKRENTTSREETSYARHCLAIAEKDGLAGDGEVAKTCVPPPIAGLSEKLSDSIRTRYRQPAFWRTAVSEREADADNIAAMKTALPLPKAMPLLVLGASAGRDWVAPADRAVADAAYRKGQQRIAASSSRGEFVAVEKSTHAMYDDRPDAIVAAIDKITTELSSRSH